MSEGEIKSQNPHEKVWDYHGSYQWTYFGEHVKQRISYFLSQRLSGRNLEIGGGWYLSYPNSVVLDLSSVCLEYNPAKEKLQFDMDALGVDGKLPFADQSFDSATMVSVWQYLKYPHSVVSELERVVKPGGEVYIISGQGAGLEECIVNITTSEQVQNFFQEKGFDAFAETIFIPCSSARNPNEFQSICVAMPEVNLFGEKISQLKNKAVRVECNTVLSEDPHEFEVGFVASEIRKMSELLGEFRRYPITQYSRDYLVRIEELSQKLYQLNGELPIMFCNLSSELELSMLTPSSERFSGDIAFIGENSPHNRDASFDPAINETINASGIYLMKHIDYFYGVASASELLKYCQDYSMQRGKYDFLHQKYYSSQEHYADEKALRGILGFLSTFGLNSFARRLQRQIYEVMQPQVPDLDKRLSQERARSYYYLLAEVKQRRRIDDLIKHKESVVKDGVLIVGEGELETFSIISEFPEFISES